MKLLATSAISFLLLVPVLAGGAMAAPKAPLIPAGTPLPPGSRIAVTCIANGLNIPMKYQHRWGADGEWVTNTVATNTGRTHAWTYRMAAGEQPPQLYIRLDSDPGAGVVPEIVEVGYLASEHIDCFRTGKVYDLTITNGKLGLVLDPNPKVPPKPSPAAQAAATLPSYSDSADCDGYLDCEEHGDCEDFVRCEDY